MKNYDNRYKTSSEDMEKFVFSKPGQSPTNYLRLFMELIIIAAVVAGLYFFFTSESNLLDYLSNNRKSVNTTIDAVQVSYKENKKETLDFYLNKDITILGRYSKSSRDGSILYLCSYGGETSIHDAEVHLTKKSEIKKISLLGLGTAVKVEGKITYLDGDKMVIKATSIEKELL